MKALAADIDAAVEIKPSNLHVHCTPGETLIECAWRAGLYWPTICGGKGHCGACRCEILSGQENVVGMDDKERDFFERNPAFRDPRGKTRLACCVKVRGSVTVFKAGVEPK